MAPYLPARTQWPTAFSQLPQKFYERVRSKPKVTSYKTMPTDSHLTDPCWQALKKAEGGKRTTVGPRGSALALSARRGLLDTSTLNNEQHH